MQLQQPQSLDSHTNPPMQPVQGSMAAMQHNNLTNLQHNSLSGVPTISNSQQHMINTVQPGSNVDLGQGNSLSSLQQVATGSLQNPVNSPQQVNISSLSSQSGTNPIQANFGSLQQNSNSLQHSLPKQQEQQMLQNQQFVPLCNPLLMQQQFFQGQQLMQQQQAMQLRAHQMSQLHQMTDANDLKMNIFHQKSGISSPQLLQELYPFLQIDQQNMLASLTKAGTPLPSTSSPFVVPSPSTPLAPSPMPGDSEKVCAGLASHTTAGNIMHQRATAVSAPQLYQALSPQGSMAAMQQNNLTNLQHNSLSGVSKIADSQQHMINIVQPGSSLGLGQGNSLMLLQNQQLIQQCNQLLWQQQLFQRQQLMQQQQAMQLRAHQMSQLRQMTDANDLKMRQQMGMNTGVLQQQQSVGQRVVSHHPQLKSGISSPQLHQALSPQWREKGKADGNATLPMEFEPNTSTLEGIKISPASLDSTAQTGNAKGADWQEEVYQKIKSMREMYLSDLNGLYQKIASGMQQAQNTKYLHVMGSDPQDTDPEFGRSGGSSNGLGYVGMVFGVSVLLLLVLICWVLVLRV